MSKFVYIYEASTLSTRHVSCSEEHALAIEVSEHTYEELIYLELQARRYNDYCNKLSKDNK